MRILREEKGSVLVLVAIGMIVFLGMTALVLDSGQQYITKSRLQNAVDAAALAGAQDLVFADDGVTATATATTYLDENGIILPEVGVENPDDISITFNNPDYTEITVTATRDVSFRFAPIFGNDDKYKHNTIGASAKVAVYPIKSTTGVLPIGIRQDSFKLGEPIKVYTETNSPGNFGWVDLDGDPGGGANAITEWVANGYEGELSVDDTIYSEPGKMQNAVEELNKKIRDCDASCTYGNIEPNCPRLVIVPIIDDWPLPGGSGNVTIVGFAQLLLPETEVDWVDSPYGNGKILSLTGTFVGGITSGSVDPSQQDFGLKGVRLIQ